MRRHERGTVSERPDRRGAAFLYRVTLWTIVWLIVVRACEDLAFTWMTEYLHATVPALDPYIGKDVSKALLFGVISTGIEIIGWLNLGVFCTFVWPLGVFGLVTNSIGITLGAQVVWFIVWLTVINRLSGGESDKSATGSVPGQPEPIGSSSALSGQARAATGAVGLLLALLATLIGS